MADNTQANSTLLAHQAHTHSATDVSVVGNSVDVQSWFEAQIYVYHANIEITANATGVTYILQANPTVGADDEAWVDLVPFRTGTTASVAAEISGAEVATSTTIEVDADTGGKILWVHETDNYRIRPEPETYLAVLRDNRAVAAGSSE